MHDRPEGIEYRLADQCRNTAYAALCGELIRHEHIHCAQHSATLLGTVSSPEGGHECCVDLLALHRPVIHNNHEPNTKHTIRDRAEDLPKLNPFCAVDSTSEFEKVVREPLSMLSAELGADRVPRSIKTWQINTYIPRRGFAGYHCCRDAMLLEGLPNQHHGVEIGAGWQSRSQQERHAEEAHTLELAENDQGLVSPILFVVLLRHGCVIRVGLTWVSGCSRLGWQTTCAPWLCCCCCCCCQC
mmetsp:Transcript_125398/g.400967  ORF Transcript_125398/g.400967 Transcript_125398/m.400967 type:complete len:243 (-) Transcript_125398:1005-1733(-)